VVYADLVGGLAEASVYDEVIGLMARRGHDIPGELLGRDFAEEHVPHGAVEEAWVRIYAEDRPDNDLRSLGEVLVDVAEGFDEWRTQHVRAVQRAMGDKPGSGGSAGLTWLRRSLERVVFPELWSARTDM
jgi:tryptophan 2,3-dioxygenase